jgi:MFS superfamily sulfate permease-like transporter
MEQLFRICFSTVIITVTLGIVAAIFIGIMQAYKNGLSK